MKPGTKTEELIQNLADQASPVRPLPPVRVRLLRWLGAAVLCQAAGIAILGLRADAGAALLKADVILQSAGLILVSILSAFGAFSLSVPGEEKGPLLRKVPLLAVGAWMVLLLALVVQGKGIAAGMGLFCVRDILLLAVPPGVLLFIMVRAAYPLKLGWSGALAALSVAALGALGTQWICRNDSPMHVLLWHFLPVVFLGLVGVVLGRRLLRRGAA